MIRSLLQHCILALFVISVGCSSETNEDDDDKKPQSKESPQLSDSNATSIPRIVQEAPGFVYPDGAVTIYYDNGHKHSSGLYKNAKKEGVWVYFGSEAEVIIRREVYDDGKKVSEESSD